MLTLTELLEKNIKKLSSSLKSEDKLIKILKKRLTKKEFKSIMMTVQGLSSQEQMEELGLDEKRYKLVSTKALKKVNFHDLKEELSSKEEKPL